jgi:hypothetical protein
VHWILVENKITKDELRSDLLELFKDDKFFFHDDIESDGIPVELYENNSLFKSQIELFIQNESLGFRYADKLAEYLSVKYECDTVRELHSEVAQKEFNNENYIQVFSVLNRKGKKYIISDEGIEEDGFKIIIDREIKTNYNTT